MAQRPTGDWAIDPNSTSGTDLANILNRFQDAIDSGNSGASRPPYLAAGGLWVQEGNPMKLFFWDGSTDTEIFNTQAGVIGGMDEPTDDGEQYARQGDTAGNFSWAKVEHPEPIDGVDGKGWTAGAYDDSTGVVTFDSDDGLGFSTDDLRGADGADGGTALVSDTEPSNPSSGTLWYDSANESLFVWDGTQWAGLGSSGPPEPPPASFSASGGTETEFGPYKIHTFNSSGDLTVTGEGEVEFLVIGGGGGAGGFGGGGAGGYRNSTATEASGGKSATETTLTLTAGVYNIIVGAGGAPATGATSVGISGNESSFSTITSLGGGGGSGRAGGHSALNGGSGGGSTTGTKGQGTIGQGFDGGSGATDNLSWTSGGGGGGAGEAGETVPSRLGGKGGDGLYSEITGTLIPRAGGGGGSTDGNDWGAGGVGGGGDASDGGANFDGKANTGGGGGVNSYNPPYGKGNGGSGVVIIRYEKGV